MSLHAHPDAALLEAFLAGEVGERTAVWIASHIDDCPRCAAWMREHDPLDAAWQVGAHVPIPSGLAEGALRALEDRERREARTPVALGAALCVAGAALGWAASPELPLDTLFSSEILGAVVASVTEDSLRTSGLAGTAVLGALCAIAVARVRGLGDPS